MPLLRNIHNRRTTRQRHINPHRILATSLLLPALALADDEPTSSTDQVSEPFVDQVTGLTMERFFGVRTSFTFALALPDSAPANGTAGSFIGQLQFPLANGEGWGAAGLTGDMEGNFILAAWPDGKGGVMASFRQAIDEDNPAEVKGNFKVRPIPDGVSVNETSLLYTFLCENCLDSTLGLGPEAAVGNAVMGWALSERPPRGDPSNPGAFLGFHERGFGPFTARLAQAKTAGFDAVAAKALDPVGDSGSAVATVPNAFLDGGSDDEDSGDEGAGTGGGVGGGNDVDNDSGDESGDEDDD
ncbi:cellobiose dehydrogenase [Fusarium mundagurra]|uniref:Cellobiose dehydrogenase n=1 Tax=Fusarium mundagurra TaxID=1567541 RepID=A0A8H5XP81_9HYPO|nr:cellobiose dehydrogenase [Fusarium mundagurra]